MGEFYLICVSIFCFLSGYGWRLSLKKSNFRAKHIIKIYMGYWISISIILIIINVFSCEPTLAVAQQHNYIYEYLCFTQNICFFSWYILFYAVAVLCYPYIYKYSGSLKKVIIFSLVSFLAHIGIWKLSSIILIPDTVYMLFNKLTLYLPTVLVGSFCAEKDYINKMLKKFKDNSTIGCLLTLFITYIIYGFFDLIVQQQKIAIFLFTFLVPFVIVSLIKIIYKFNNRYLNLILMRLGKLSLFYWLLQALFFYTKIQSVIYFPKYSVLILIWSIMALTPLSFLGDYINTNICNSINKILKYTN